LKRDKVKSAIAKRGWNLLNYILLDHPNLVSNLIASSTNASASISTSSALDCNTMDSINQTVKKFIHYLHLFIVNETKKEGRKRKLEEQQKEEANRDANFFLLSTYTRIAASLRSLVKHNIFEIGKGLLA
jgi:hypothetical protein